MGVWGLKHRVRTDMGDWANWGSGRPRGRNIGYEQAWVTRLTGDQNWQKGHETYTLYRLGP